MTEPRFSPKPGEVSAMYEKHSRKRRRKSSRACSTKARMAFWFVCVAMGVLLGGMRYNANPEEGAVWEKAYACMLGSGPLGGQSAIVLFAALNLALGTTVAALAGIIANRLGFIGVVIIVAGFALLCWNQSAWGMPTDALMQYCAAATVGLALGWSARQNGKRIL